MDQIEHTAELNDALAALERIGWTETAGLIGRSASVDVGSPLSLRLQSIENARLVVESTRAALCDSKRMSDVWAVLLDDVMQALEAETLAAIGRRRAA